MEDENHSKKKEINMQIKFKRDNKEAKLPQQANPNDAGYDLFSIENIILKPYERAMVQTGLRMEMPDTPILINGIKFIVEAQIRPRSGNAFKKGLTVLNSPGTIDAGYRGPINVILVNLGQQEIEIKKGDKVAQIIFNLVILPDFEQTFSLSFSVRGNKGFGSSGTIDNT